MRATIGITAGDPAGIGLEVVLKSISSGLSSARWVLFTDRAIFNRNTSRFDPAVMRARAEQFSHDVFRKRFAEFAIAAIG